MNVLIIAANCNRRPTPVMPFGACIVAEALERKGHEVNLLDLMFCKNSSFSVETELKKSRPDVVGLSVRNIDNNDMRGPESFYEGLGPVIDTVRSNSGAPVVVGGPAVEVMPEQFMRFTRADWGVVGDGESIFPDLLDALSNGNYAGALPGVACFEDGCFRLNRFFPAQSPDCNLSPDFYRWFDVRAYLSRLASVPILSRRGCPFACIYCTYSRGEGSEYRLWPPETIAAAIKRLVSCGLKDFEFVDNVFNSPLEHAMLICEAIARASTGARLLSVQFNPMFIDRPLLFAMEQAGFVGMGITAESASDFVLDRLRKGFTAAEVHRAAQIVSEHDIPCLWLFLLGGPGETEATVCETLAFADKHVRAKDTVFFNMGIRIYPGTELESIARNEGVLSLDAAEMLGPVFYFSPELDQEWLAAKLHNAVATHANFITCGSFRLPLLPAINRLGYFFGMRPPLWRNTRTLRNVLNFFGVTS